MFRQNRNVDIDEGKEDPPWKKELIMKKTALSRSFQKSADASYRTDVPKSTTPPRVSPTKNVSLAVYKRPSTIRPRKSPENKKMPGAGIDSILRNGNLHDINQTNSDSTFSDCGHSPSFSSCQSDAFSFDSNIDSSTYGELEYGPGIVNRLKSRFIHLTLKESERASQMIPLNSNSGKMRRYASLEGLVDSNIHHKSTTNTSTVDTSPTYISNNRSMYFQNYNARRSNMKKARSMDNLGFATERSSYLSMNKSNTYDCDLNKMNANPILINENVVIIESLANGRKFEKNSHSTISSIKERPSIESTVIPGIEDHELPKPDTVKTFKQMFEAKKSPESSSAKPTFAHKFSKQRTSVSKGKTSPTIGIERDIQQSSLQENLKSDKTIKHRSDNLISNVENSHLVKENSDDGFTRVEELELPNNVPECDLKRTDDISLKVNENENSILNASANSNLNKSKDKVIAAVNNSSEQKQEIVNHSLPHSQVDSESSVKPFSNKSPHIVSVQSKNEDKPIANIKPIINAQRNADARKNVFNESKTDRISNNKSQTQTSDLKSSTEEKLVHALSALPKPRNWHKAQESSTSVVFDFRDRKDVKPHIATRVAPFGCRPAKSNGISIDGIDGEESCDYDVDDDYKGDLSLNILPCNVEFEGSHMIIGKSAMLSNRNKQLKIQFDDDAISTFEYPSETAMESESSSPSSDSSSIIPYADADEESPESPPSDNQQNDLDSRQSDSSSGSSLLSNPALGSSGALSSYTPLTLSKQEDKFELGVSRHVHVTPMSEKESSMHSEGNDTQEEYLKPAENDQTSSWSSATSSDLLF